MSTQANIVRLECDLGEPLRTLANKISGGRVEMPRSVDTILEIGVRERTIWQDDIEDFIASITVEVKATRTGSAVVTVVDSGPFVTCAEGSWDDNTSQHAAITLPSAQTQGFSVSATTFEADYWLVVSALTISGKQIVLAAGTMKAIETGANYSATTPNPGDSVYITAAVFYSVIGAINTGEISENGYRGRWGIDANGQPVFRLLN